MGGAAQNQGLTLRSYINEYRGVAKMGRPRKAKSERRSRTVRLRMSSSEYRKLAERAKAAGITVSEFLRQCAKD